MPLNKGFSILFILCFVILCTFFVLLSSRFHHPPVPPQSFSCESLSQFSVNQRFCELTRTLNSKITVIFSTDSASLPFRGALHCVRRLFCPVGLIVSSAPRCSRAVLSRLRFSCGAYCTWIGSLWHLKKNTLYWTPREETQVIEQRRVSCQFTVSVQARADGPASAWNHLENHESQ